MLRPIAPARSPETTSPPPTELRATQTGEQLLTLEEAAARGSWTPRELRAMVRREEVSAYRLGNGPRARLRFRWSEIEAALRPATSGGPHDGGAAMIIDSDYRDQERPLGTVRGGAQGGLSEAVFGHRIMRDYLARGIDVNRPRDVVVRDLVASDFGRDGRERCEKFLDLCNETAPGHMIGIFGYVGHAYRSVELDREMEASLRALGLGDDGIALILTSKVGRKTMDEVIGNGKTVIQTVLVEAATIIDIDRGEFWGHPLLLAASIKLGEDDDVVDVSRDYFDLWNAAAAMCDAAGYVAVGAFGEADRWCSALREMAVRGDLTAYRLGDGARATLYFRCSEIEVAARKVRANAEAPALRLVGDAS
jgi:hypothetical protein